MPPGIQPPIVVQFNASSVPVLQLSLNSDSLNDSSFTTSASIASASSWHRFPRHAADPGRRQISSDHGGHDPDSFCPGIDAARYREMRSILRT